MGQDKKQLAKLLDYVKDLYSNPDNKEFAAGIQSIVLNDKQFYERLFSNNLKLNPESLEKIETYLSLDYHIDFKNSPDYSLIANEAVRVQLNKDYREMLRYEYGTRSHKIDFSEFCRYAVLQIEMLVNYYFETKYPNIDAIIDEIKQTSDKYNPPKPPKSVSEIYITTKLYHLKAVFNWSSNKLNHFFYPIYVRNMQSHRSLIVDYDIISETEEKLKAAGAWLYESDSPDYRKTESGKQKAVEAVGQDTINDYKFQIWLDKQPFGEVLLTIKDLAKTISDNIK